MASTERKRRFPRLGLFLVAVAVLYGVGAVATGLVLLTLGDRHWLGTLLCYAPRWPILAPAVMLVPVLAIAGRYAAAAATTLVAVFVAWPVMGWVAPGGGGGAAEDGQLELRIITLNAQGAELTDPRIVRLLEDEDPDVMVLQECGTRDDTAPVPDGYHLRANRPLCFLSKLPFLSVHTRDPSDVYARYGSGEITLVELESPKGSIFLQNVHLETVREGLEAIIHDRFEGVPAMDQNIEQRRWESELASGWTRRADGPLIVAGDFNLPIESAIYKEYWGDFDNAFGRCGSGYGNTKETKLFGVRIDHVLMDRHWECRGARVGARVGSDHRPLIVDLTLR